MVDSIFFNQKESLEKQVSEFLDQQFDSIIDFFKDIKKEKKNLDMKDINELMLILKRESNEKIEELITQSFSIIIKRINELRTSENKSYIEPELFRYNLKNNTIVFNELQSKYIKLIMQKLPFIDKGLFLNRCAILLIEKGNKSFSRTIRFFYENNLKSKAILSF